MQLLNKKDGRAVDDRPSLVKQFPKLSIIKLSALRNPYDYHLLKKSQQLFSQEANNIQFIELWEEDMSIDQGSQGYEPKKF